MKKALEIPFALLLMVRASASAAAKGAPDITGSPTNEVKMIVAFLVVLILWLALLVWAKRQDDEEHKPPKP